MHAIAHTRFPFTRVHIGKCTGATRRRPLLCTRGRGCPTSGRLIGASAATTGSSEHIVERVAEFGAVGQRADGGRAGGALARKHHRVE